MNIFNKESVRERIGDVKKSETLGHLREVEKYFMTQVKRYKIEVSYDVIANELPYFKTLNYTEWAHSFIMHPLQQELRLQQMVDAFNDPEATEKFDFVKYFAERLASKSSNKYAHINTETRFPPRDNLVILVGSNKLKERICLNKLRWIRDVYEDEVYIKPHPLTTYQLVGELKDLFGNDAVLDRDVDVYQLMLGAKKVFTSHMSESAVYAICSDKTIDPIDAYNKVEQGSFYHINTHLFNQPDPKAWLNKTLNSPKCGIVNPEITSDWKQRIDSYLEYIMAERAKHKNKYVYGPK
jgi:hypothetical protein